MGWIYSNLIIIHAIFIKCRIEGAFINITTTLRSFIIGGGGSYLKKYPDVESEGFQEFFKVI